MPPGALWTLRYKPTVDGRILARVDASRLRADEFVQSVAVNSTRGECIVAVQFHDDQDGPFDHNLRREIEQWLPPPQNPQDPEPNPLTRDELISRAIGTPIVRREFAPSWANPIRRNLDYSSVARRAFPVDSFNYEDSPYQAVNNDQVLSVTAAIESIRRLAQKMEVSAKLTGVPQEIPRWLNPGVWVTSKSEYAEVTKIEGTLEIGVRVSLKLWRVREPRTILLGVFLSYWTQCEKPEDPPSRYERILRNLR